MSLISLIKGKVENVVRGIMSYGWNDIVVVFFLSYVLCGLNLFLVIY